MAATHATRNKIGTWIGFIIILVWCLLPVAWILSLSFKGPGETAAERLDAVTSDAAYDAIVRVATQPR